MDIEFLRYYKALVECQSYTKAATASYITQSALSQAIRALERELGFDLIDRSVPGIGTTESGKAFYRAAVSALEQLDDVVARCRAQELASMSVIRLGVEPSHLGASTIALANRLAERLLEGVSLEVHRQPRADLLDALGNGAIDLVFTVEPVEGARFTCVKAISCQVAACVSTRSAHAEEEQLGISDLVGLRLFTYNESTSLGKLFKHWLGKNRLSSLHVFEDSATLESMVQVDPQLIALDIVPVVHPMPREGLHAIPITDSQGEFFIYAVQRNGFSTNNAASALKSHVVLDNLGLSGS